MMTRNQRPEIPDYSPLAEAYSVSRPGYPPELFRWLASTVSPRGLAWDAATGSGQAALGLATYFDRVLATDHSQAQIDHARPHPKIEYRVAPAEDSGLASGSVDLAVAAAAVHWFDLTRFGEEVRRVVRSRGVFAAWTYHVAHVEEPIADLLWAFYRDVVAPHFAPGARLVDERYESLRLPGERLETPAFVMSASWTAGQMLSFIRTWSGVHAYIEACGTDPVDEIAGQVEGSWGGIGRVREVRWPVYMRASRL